MIEAIAGIVAAIGAVIVAFFLGNRQGQSTGKQKERERATRADHEKADEIRRKAADADGVPIDDPIGRLREHNLLRDHPRKPDS